MKQTVEEAAREYAKCEPPRNGDEYIPICFSDLEAFVAGAEWQAKQSPWIKVKDRLPPVNEKDVSKQSEPVLVKIAAKGHYEPEILVYNKYYHVWDTADADDYYCNISDDDLWIPIPELPE